MKQIFPERAVWIPPSVPNPILPGATFVTRDGRTGTTEERQGDDGYVFADMGGGISERVRLSDIKDIKRVWE